MFCLFVDVVVAAISVNCLLGSASRDDFSYFVRRLASEPTVVSALRSL